jgi:hypothetical protein
VSEEDRNRHAVNVAARREDVRIGVRVRIEPQHAELALVLAGVLRSRGDRADGERVVAADEDRQPRYGKLCAAGVVHGTIPGRDFPQMAIAVDGRQARVAGAVQVAAVEHLDALRFEHGLQVRDTQRLRPHRRAARAGTDVRGSADDRNLLHGTDIATMSRGARNPAEMRGHSLSPHFR